MTLFSLQTQEWAMEILNKHHRVFKYTAYVLGVFLTILFGLLVSVFLYELRDHFIRRKAVYRHW